MKHCCVEDPADLCSININGQEFTDVKEDDFKLFDNVAYVNAAENYLPFGKLLPKIRQVHYCYLSIMYQLFLNIKPC